MVERKMMIKTRAQALQKLGEKISQERHMFERLMMDEISQYSDAIAEIENGSNDPRIIRSLQNSKEYWMATMQDLLTILFDIDNAPVGGVPSDGQFYLSFDDGKTWVHVAKEIYVKTERAAGFTNTLGQPKEPATTSFSGFVSGPIKGCTFKPDEMQLESETVPAWQRGE